MAAFGVLQLKTCVCAYFMASFYHLHAMGEVHTVEYTAPRTCETQNYYDIAMLTCKACASGDQASYQMVDNTGCSCKCKPGFRMINYTNSGGINCYPCPANKVTSLDGWHCVSCDNEIPYSNITEECELCSDGQITADQQLDGTSVVRECASCTSGTQPNVAGDKCVPCLDPLLSGKASCICSSSNRELVDGICFDKNDLIDIPDQQSLYIVKYDTQEVESSYFCQHVRAAIAMCQMYRNASACQLLANLCSLLYYRHVGEPMNACVKYLKLTPSGSGNIQWPPNAPWLYYLTDTVEETLHKKDVDATYSFKKEAGNSQLNFTTASYSMDGTFLNLNPVDGSTWQLCPGSFDVLNAAFNFGTRYSYKCLIPVKKLWEEYKTIFYDPYLYYDVPGKSSVLYAVPVMILNYVENGQAVNRGSSGQWKFVRRFYLVDNVSGRSPCADPSATTNIVRYAKDITFRIEMYRISGEASHIYPPLVTVDYGETTLDDYFSNKEVEVSFTVMYEMDQSKEERDFSIGVGVLSSFAIIFSAIQTWSWSKRSGRLGIDLFALGKLLLYSCGNLSTVFLTVTFFTCFYIFVVFKRQDVVFVVLPTADQELPFIIFIVIALFLKFVHLVHVLVEQVTFDIFFVDWERPRAKRNIPNPAEKDKKDNDGEDIVSIWRTYLVANEWLELQTMRKTCLGFQILTTVFFLKVVGFENLASADSSSNFFPSSYEYVSSDSLTCRLAVGIGVYAVVAIIQWAFFSLIYEQFIEDKIKQFVDLCSISNVSVFIMSFRQFGYYIHGRSVHGHADTDMKTMYEQLRREEDNLCSQRGLLLNSEHQTFQMALPAQLRAYYDQVMGPLMQTSPFPGRLGAGGRNPLSECEPSIQAYQSMNKFLAAFLEHALRNLDYIVKSKLFAENILDMEFQEPTDKGYFYEDNGHSYDAVLLCGQEFVMTIFDLLLFICIDLAAHDFILSGFITFVISKVIVFLYTIFSRRNLARKTLVDSRFLI